MTVKVDFKLDKRTGLIGVLLLAVAPWLSGGSEPINLLIMAAAALIGLFLLLRMPDGPAPIGRSRLALAGVAFVGWGALSLIWSVNRFQTIKWLVPLVLALTVFAIARQFHGHWKEWHWWLNGYVLIATVFSLYGLWIFLTEDYNRLTSSFWWANPAAIWLLPAVLWCGWYWAETKQRFYLYTGAIVLAAFILTDSRTALILLGLVGLFVAFKLRRKTDFWRRAALLVILGLALTVVMDLGRGRVYKTSTAAPGSRLADAISQESISRTDRLYYIKSALEIWRDHPVIGTGAGTFVSVHPQYQIRVISAAANAHNFYAQTLSELGLVGAGLLVWLAVELLVAGWRAVKTDYRAWPLAIGLAVLLVHLGLDIDSNYPALIWLLAVVAGLVVVTEAGEVRRSYYAAGLLLVVLAVLWPARDLYFSQLQADRGQADQTSGDYGQAAADYDRAHHGLMVYDPEVLTREGINYFTLAHYSSPVSSLNTAEDLALKAIKLDRQAGQPYYLLAQVKRQKGEVAAAEQAYKEAIAHDPYDDPDYYNNLAQLYVANSDQTSALAYLDKVISLYPDGVVANRHTDPNIDQQISNALTTRGQIYILRQQIPQARADLKRAVRLNFNNRYALQLLFGIGTK